MTANDSLNLISLRYDVPKDAIRMANDFTGDSLLGRKTLKVPYTRKLNFLTFN